MERLTRWRAGLLVLVLGIMLTFFAGRLYFLQIVETGGNTSNITTFTTYTRVRAARGDILDRDGNVLVGNRSSYDLVLNHYVLTSSDSPNASLYKLIQLARELGIDYADHFPVTKERPFTYTLEDYSSTWQSYFQKFVINRDLDSDITAPMLIEQLRKSYYIPEEWSDEEARLVIGLRYELTLRTLSGVGLANYVFLEDASDEQLAAVVELHIPGMNVEASTVRVYHTEYAAHILGYVGAMSPTQWEYYQNIDGYAMDAQVGQSGLEAAFEEYLHGVDGTRIDTVTRDGTVIESYYVEGQEPKAGNNVQLSIDLKLQMTAEDKLAQVMEELRAAGGDGYDAEGGAVVAMDVKTGEILVCGSYPSYDLSSFFENYKEIESGDYRPLVNRALNAIYPPGSTYKMSMVIAGIQSGVISSSSEIVDMGVYTAWEGITPSCLQWTNYGTTHGAVNAAEALEVSCNYFFYWLADHINISITDETAKMMGLGEATGVELPESIGRRANPETKKELHSGSDREWYAADRVFSAIGQSDNAFTPLQLCVYATTLANQGTRYQATFLNRVVSADYRSLILEQERKVMSQMDISADAIAAYSEGMKLVATDGTAWRTFGNYPITVAAKTGTAETGVYGTSDNAAFICYAPADDPQIAVAVYGEKAGHGSAVASVAKAILDVYFDVDEIGEVTVIENQVS